MARRLQSTFEFFDTEEKAIAFEKTQKRWRRGAVTPWDSKDGKEHLYVAWYRR